MSRPFITGYQGFFNSDQEVTIAEAATLSSIVNCGGMVLTGIFIPELITSSELTFLVGNSEDGFQSQGLIDFTGNPSDGETFSINTFVLTFKNTSPGIGEIQIGATAADTAQNLYNFFQISLNPDVLLSTYSIVINGSLGSITATAVASGSSGDDIVFATDSGNISLTQMSGGGFHQLYDDTNTAVSLDISGGLFYAMNTDLFQGVPFLQIQGNASEASDRTLILTLKGF